ncbi:EamA family transporter [Pseudorhizobium flavum]|uniref:EamA family transporter n=1 Tax=Pseudorhizobium flavum TaxID=1335061 RepID=UPI0037704237
MPLDVILLVLFGACLHAAWNALIKSGQDKSLDAALVAVGAAVLSLPLLPLVPLPEPQAWPLIMASAVLQFAYFRLIAAAYRVADVALVYPIMRGCAPLLVAATSGFFLKEHLSSATMAAIATISVGILILVLDRRGRPGGGVFFALTNSCVIAAYTFVDGAGARLSGNSISYTLWMSILPASMLLGWAWWSRGNAVVFSYIRKQWWKGLLGGGCSLASYGLALWAMTRAPVATVAALRETSIVFAFLISVLILKEPASLFRLLAVCIIAIGAFNLR